MSLALFDAPPRVTISNPDAVGGSRVGLLLGFTETEDDYVAGIICAEGGEVMVVNRAWFTVDFRYDPRSDQFKDKDAQEPDQEG